MTMKERIQADTIAAMKSKDELTLSTLRMLTSAMRNKEIEKRPAVLTDDDMLAVIGSEVK